MTGKLVNPLARHDAGVVFKARAVKQWTRETLALSEDVVVSVNEIACSVPGCAPRETVILVMWGRGETRQVSIHKPLIQVDFRDVETAWRHLTR